jgi:DNA polymerase III epsilon subunit-like protein
MLNNFKIKWSEVPTVWIDTETTGILPGYDKAVQIGIIRFENLNPVGKFLSYVHPYLPIPDEATAIHGITNELVQNAESIRDIFEKNEVQNLLKDAQPGAYNGLFDKHFIIPFGDWTWPWFDCLTFIRHIDKYVPGKGRHKLCNSCSRYDIPLSEAHDALADAWATAELFYTVVPKFLKDCKYPNPSLGMLLKIQRELEAVQWFEYNKWRSDIK